MAYLKGREILEFQRLIIVSPSPNHEWSSVKQYVLFRTITVQSAYSCPVTHTCTPVFTDIEMWNWLKMRYVLRYNHVCAMFYDIIMCVHAGIGLHITHGGQSWAMADKLHW
jgi:hypothetical protein